MGARNSVSALLVLSASLAWAGAVAAQPAPPASAKPVAPPASAKPVAPPASAKPVAPPAPQGDKPAGDKPAQPKPAQPAQPAPAKGGQPAKGPDAAPQPPPTGQAGPAQPEITPQAEPLVPAQPQPSPQPAPATKAGAASPPPAVATPDPDRDAKQLKEQGKERPSSAGDIGAKPSDVYAEDWWSHARPTFELHGYYRVRAELFHNFALGRKDAPGTELWPQPADNDYLDVKSTAHPVAYCGDDPTGKLTACENNTQAGANMRFRLNPELHISDNLRVLSQIDLLDNLVLGSTPDGLTNEPSADGGYRVVARGGYSPTGAFATTQWAPSAGRNSTSDSIAVKRVWGEYMTPVGLLRFGRMPSHWGLGILANGGDGYDSDWASTADRIMLVTGIKKYDIYFAGAWDFPNEGAISSPRNEAQGQQYDLGQYDDVSQYVLVAVRRRNPELQKLELARGDVVLNGGVYFVLRNQFLSNEATDPANGANLGQKQGNIAEGFQRRGATAYIPDVWFQFNYKKFRFEMEGVAVLGDIENTARPGGGSNVNNSNEPDNPGWKIRQFGMATQTEYKAIEDRLKIQFGFGYASGDDDVASLAPQGEGLQPQLTADRTFSTFRFHPDYRIDLILWRNILNRVQGAYYFRPSVEYDFTRDKNGQRLGGNAAVVWSRASEFVQTPGHARDLGIELDFSLYYQSKDGTLNDDPDKMGGFYTQLQYGVMFPLGGLGYLPDEAAKLDQLGVSSDTSTAQTLRWFIGVLF